MAKPIREIKRVEPAAEELQAKALTDLMKAITDNRDAIMDMIDILHHLHDMGALEAVKGLLAQRHEVGAIAVQQLNQPKMHHTIKNAFTALEMAGSIKPEHLQKLVKGLAQGLEAANDLSDSSKPPSLWDLAKAVRDPSVRASMATMVGLMQGWGESMTNDNESTQLQ